MRVGGVDDRQTVAHCRVILNAVMGIAVERPVPCVSLIHQTEIDTHVTDPRCTIRLVIDGKPRVLVGALSVDAAAGCRSPSPRDRKKRAGVQRSCLLLRSPYLTLLDGIVVDTKAEPLGACALREAESVTTPATAASRAVAPVRPPVKLTVGITMSLSRTEYKADWSG
jgi:hypothetical protein